MSASISCVVTSYNNGPWLKQCVESVLAQTRRVDEIVIADDASTDGSQDLIRSLAEQRPEIRPVLRETNVGVATNRDLAVREARGELITTLDGDDYYYLEKIEREIRAFDDTEAATVIFSDLDFVDPSGVVLKGVDFARLESLRGAALVQYLAFRAGPIPRDMLFPKSLFLEAGGFRHALKMYEDWDLKLRLAREANAWRRVSAPGMAYRRHGNGLASADGLTHLESQVAVIFANRHWLEPMLGADAFGRAVLARVQPQNAAGASGPEPRPGRDPAATLDTLAVQAQAAYRRQEFGEAAALMKQLVQSPSHARKYQIKLAHTLLLSAPWHELSSFLPAGTNDLLVSGWLNSVFRGAPVNADGRPVPWYTYPAIEFLERTAGADERVFEWGSGNSTLWWAERARQVVSVEHNRGWYEQIRSAMPQHVTLQHCVAAEDYVVQIAKYPKGTFSTVVIDGEARNECARLAAEYADAGGIIVFDNSDRRAFGDGVAHLSAQGWKRIDFYGLIPSYLYKNCTSVFFQDDAVLQRAGLPANAASCLGPTCSQVLGQ